MNKTVKGLNINYTEAGEGELVVFLHGWGANYTLFQPAIDLVSRKYRAVALDFPGFGKSEEPKEPWDVGDYADFLLEFLADYHAKKVILLGHSFGGRVIFKLYEKKLPFEIDKIILVDAAGIKPKKTLSQYARIYTYKLGKHVLNLPPVRALFPDALEKFRKSRGSEDYNAASPIMRQCLVRVVNEDLSHVFSKILAPTLLIWGSADDATPLSDAKRMEAEIKDAGLVVFEGMGHFSFLQQPQQFLRVVASFLEISE